MRANVFFVCFSPHTAEEWDDLLVECKNQLALSKTAFEALVAAVEFFFPRHRRKLQWAHAVLAGRHEAHIPAHTEPAGRALTAWIGSHLSAAGVVRYGAGIQVQVRLGLRPSELLEAR